MTRAELYEKVIAFVAENAMQGEDPSYEVDIRPLPDKAQRLAPGKVRCTYGYKIMFHKPEGRVIETFTGSEDLPQ